MFVFLYSAILLGFSAINHIHAYLNMYSTPILLIFALNIIVIFLILSEVRDVKLKEKENIEMLRGGNLKS